MRSRTCPRSARLSVVLMAAGSLALLQAIPAAAMCGEPLRELGMPQAFADPQAAVFVGTAAETRNNDYNGLFHVEEIWSGGPVPEWQAVLGAERESFWTWLEDNPTWQVGTRYLVMAHRRGSVLFSVPCAATQRYSSVTAAYRPSTVMSPTSASRPLLWAWRPFLKTAWPVLLVIALGVVIATVIVVWLSRRQDRSRRAPRTPPSGDG
jgi:hypothetical protein